jgi:Glucose dehydrogenase
MRYPLLIGCLALATHGGDAGVRTPARIAASAADTAPAVMLVRRAMSADTGHDWTRFGWDVGRSSTSTAPAAIDAANVGSLRRQQVEIDGPVDASAVYLHDARVLGSTHDVFFVTTTYGKTLAIDADDGTILWRYTPPGYDGWDGTHQITTSTPVADPDREFLYAASPDGRIQKLAVADGHAVWSTAITKLPQREKIASPLNYWHGRVIATTGGYIGDAPPYQGHVAIIDGASGRLLHVWNSLCSDRPELIDPDSCVESGSAIWGRAGAVIDSTTGNIFVATGNGRWDGRTHWGDAVIELDSNATQLLGNYTPTNTDRLNASDDDLGSTSPVLLGGGYIAQGGKDGKIRLLGLRQIRGDAPHLGGELQTVHTPSGADMFTAPAVMHVGTATWLFAADRGGTAAWTLRDGRLQPTWKNGNGGTSPVVAGGLLYVYDPGGGLRVYEPRTGRQLTNLECDGGHWNSPIVADGRIALPEGSDNGRGAKGVLDIWRPQ